LAAAPPTGIRLASCEVRHRSAKSEGGSAFETVLLSKAIRDPKGPLIGSLIFSPNLNLAYPEGEFFMGEILVLLGVLAGVVSAIFWMVVGGAV
jgi:hypothetical protein